MTGVPAGHNVAEGRRVIAPMSPGGKVRAARVLRELGYVVVAAALAVLLAHIPALDSVVYPFKLFGTFVHEWAHALVTLATGGHIVALQVNSDLSGEEFSSGGWGVLIASAGYVGTACAGAALLLAPLRRAGRTLVAIAGSVVILTLAAALALGTTFTLTTWVWAAVFAAATGLIGRRATPRLAALFQQFLALELCLAALDALRVLDWLSFNAPGIHTDATNAATATHLPAAFWAVLWSIVGVAVVGLAAVRLVRRALRAPHEPPLP